MYLNNKLTIITINYNNAIGLQKTIESVVTQTNKNFEYWVIDGASTDESLSIIEQYAKQFPVKYISEKDKGIYDAMNKGIKLAEGEYLLFLNSGDTLYESTTVEHSMMHLTNDISIISGNLLVVTADKKSIHTATKSVTLMQLVEDTIKHPSTFINKNLFSKYGLYDDSLKIVADWAFFFKAVGLGAASYKAIPQTISIFTQDGISSKEESRDIICYERGKVLNDLIPDAFKDMVTELAFLRKQHKKRLHTMISDIESNTVTKAIATALLYPLYYITQKLGR